MTGRMSLLKTKTMAAVRGRTCHSPHGLSSVGLPRLLVVSKCSCCCDSSVHVLCTESSITDCSAGCSLCREKTNGRSCREVSADMQGARAAQHGSNK